MESDIFHSVLWHCWLGNRKGIRPVKKLDVGLLVVMIWLELCMTYGSKSPVVTTTSIILFFNKHRLTQVHWKMAVKTETERACIESTAWYCFTASVCQSIRLSDIGTVSKRMHIWSHFWHLLHCDLIRFDVSFFSPHNWMAFVRLNKRHVMLCYMLFDIDINLVSWRRRRRFRID